jgi:hypothetical protein
VRCGDLPRGQRVSRIRNFKIIAIDGSGNGRTQVAPSAENPERSTATYAASGFVGRTFAE